MHLIRLRGPWQLEPVVRYVARPGGYEPTSADLPAGGTATMPANWSATCGSDFLGVVRYRRSFQKPTGLEPGDKIWLVVEPPQTLATVFLAEQPLGKVRDAGAAVRFEISRLLSDRNVLVIEVEHPALDAAGCPSDASGPRVPGGLVGEVRLEIEEGAGGRGQGARSRELKD
jgi:Glycosyl hydrolase 2 galactose-binding domain-like